MALVGEPRLLRDQGERLFGTPHQGLRVLDPSLHHITLWPDPKRLLKRAAEVKRAETCHPSEIGQAQPIIKMRLNVVADPLQLLA